MSAERSVLGTSILVAALALVGLGMAVLAAGEWRPGLAMAGAGVDIAGLSRLVLSTRAAGPLRVRHSRWSDALVMCAFGTTLLVLAALLPEQPTRAG